MTTLYRYVFFSGFMVFHSLSAFPQTTDWYLADGKAMTEKKLMIPGKSQPELYKEVYRWLIKIYKDPEDILKARIENEYLRGVGYYSNCVKFGSMTSADLQYTFAFEIKNEVVTFKIFNAALIFSHEDKSMRPVENYLLAKNSQKNTNQGEPVLVMTSLTTFSNSLFNSFENQLVDLQE